MPWPQRARPQPSTPPPLVTPLSDLDPAGMEIIELDAAGRFAGMAPWRGDDSPRAVPYAAGAPDPGSLAGIWEALARS